MMSKGALAGVLCMSLFFNVVFACAYMNMKAARDAEIADHIKTIEKQKQWMDKLSSKPEALP